MDILNSSPLINILSKIYTAITNIRTQTIYERHFATGDGTNVSFNLSNIPKSYIIIYVDNKESNIDFSVSGNTVTFTSAPATGLTISAMYDIGG